MFFLRQVKQSSAAPVAGALRRRFRGTTAAAPLAAGAEEADELEEDAEHAEEAEAADETDNDDGAEALMAGRATTGAGEDMMFCALL